MSWKLDKQQGGIVGTLHIKEIDKATGEVVSEFKENNVVTIPGMGWMWKRLSDRSADAQDYMLDHFVFGSDTGLEEGGDWTIFLPKPANRMYTKHNQFPVYEDFPSSVVFNYPNGGIDDLSLLEFQDTTGTPYISGELRMSVIDTVHIDAVSGIVSISTTDGRVITSTRDIRELYPQLIGTISGIRLDGSGFLWVEFTDADDIEVGKITIPDGNTLQVGTLIDGKYVMDTLFPDQVDVVYNSATIRFKNDEVFSYKRFPVRTISRLVDVQVIWTFNLVDSALYDCSIIEPPPEVQEPDHNFGMTVYAGYWGDNTIHKIGPMGDTLWVYNKHTNWVNDLAIDEQYLYSVSRDMSIHVIDIVDGVDYQVINNAHTDIINRVMVDGEYIVTVSNDGYTNKFEMESGDLVWQYKPSNNDSFAMDVKKDPIDGMYYVAYRDGSYYKIDAADGLEMNAWDIGAELVKMEIDSVGDLYLSILDDDPNGLGYAIHKFSPATDNIRWTIRDLAGYVFGMKVDDKFNLFIGDDQETVRMFDRLGDEIWRHVRHTDIVRGLDIDQFGYLYSASIDQTVRKITPNGNQVWAYTGNENAASCVITNLTPEN